MAVIKGVNKILKSDLPDAPNWFDPIISTLNSFLDTVIGALRGRLTFKENFFSEYKDLEFTHGVELKVSTNLNSYSGMLILKTPNVEDINLAVSGYLCRQVGVKELGVTVNFAGGASKKGTCGILILG
jgi:hypothetical protein